jgi:hypothetical protein
MICTGQLEQAAYISPARLGAEGAGKDDMIVLAFLCYIPPQSTYLQLPIIHKKFIDYWNN